jgi:cysteinyl-tRNA synthetase
MAPAPLALYNTLTRAKEAFTPIDRNHIRMYICGPTVYDRAHIGNARPIIIFDILFRLLRHIYGGQAVTYARNITDVDDKINARAQERGISIRELTEETTRIFHGDVAALGCLPPTVEPRATDHIAEMAELIKRLIARGVAYEAGGHVLFSVKAMDSLPNMPRYGSLARRSLDDMLAGARVDIAPYKRDPMDFVLWKPSAEDLPGWDSPWGRGRPGWHIECSAMSWKHLVSAFETRLSCTADQQNMFDIHGGGIDLVFPHHENEVAQSCCALGSPRMANLWMHNGFLQVEGQKMSKSLGNFITIGDLLNTGMFGGRQWDGMVLRFAMLKTHYRQPIDFTAKALEEAEKTLQRWATYHKCGVEPHLAPSAEAALADDLNTPRLISELHALEASGDHNALIASLKAFGFENLPSLLRRGEIDPTFQKKIEKMIADRLAARTAKNWAESDRIRDELKSLGVELKDNKDGATNWSLS